MRRDETDRFLGMNLDAIGCEPESVTKRAKLSGDIQISRIVEKYPRKTDFESVLYCRVGHVASRSCRKAAKECERIGKKFQNRTISHDSNVSLGGGGKCNSKLNPL